MKEQFGLIKLKDCQIIQKFDGLVISSQDWRVLKPADLVLSNTSGFVDIVNSSTFKGLEFGVADCKTFKILIGNVINIVTAIVFSTTNNQNSNLTHLGLEFRELQLTIVAGMLGSLTRANWDMIDIERNRTLIEAEDVAHFGNELMRQSNNLFARTFGQVFDVQLVIAKFGQDCEFATIQNHLKIIDTDFADQIVIHYALDFETVNKALVWDRQALRDLMGRKNLTKEYNVCLLKGVGNFYFKVEPVRNDDVNNFIEAKFYSSAFKKVHRKNLPFGRPKIAQNLFSPHEYALGFCNRYVKKWNNTVQDVRNVLQAVIELTEIVKTLSARFEIIVCLRGDDTTLENVDQIPETIANHPDLSLRLVVECLRSIQIQDLQNHLTVNMLPFVKNLEHQVDKRVNAARAKTLSIISPGEYFTCLASEAIICFALYGNVSFRKRRAMFPKWLTDCLGIGRYEYNTRDEVFEFGGWMFPGIDQHPLFFRPLNKSVGDVIEQLSTSVGIQQNIIQPIVNLDNFLTDLDSGVAVEADARQHFRDVSQILIECAETSAIYYDQKRILRKRVNNRLKWLESHYDMPEVYRKCKTTMEFVVKLFRSSKRLKKHGFLLWIVSVIKYILDGRDNLLESLQLITRDQLENRLFRNHCLLPFPIMHEQCRFWVIVPVLGTLKCNFNQVTDNGRVTLLDLVQRTLPAPWSHDIILQAIQQERFVGTRFDDIIKRMRILINQQKNANLF